MKARGARGCACDGCWALGTVCTGLAMLRTPGVSEGRTTTGADGCRTCIGRNAGGEKNDGGFCTAIIGDDVGGNCEGGVSATGWKARRRRGKGKRGVE